MTKYWKLTHSYDGYELSVDDSIRTTEAYLYRHGDFFNKNETTFRRAVDDFSTNTLLTMAQQKLSGELIYDIVDKTYKLDMFLNHGIDAQLNDALYLNLLGVSDSQISDIIYHSDSNSNWIDVPKPWETRDAYLVGTNNKYKITIAPVGETNKIIEKADVAYQLTSNGEWTNNKNIVITCEAPSCVDALHPTFEVRSFAAIEFLDFVAQETNTDRLSLSTDDFKDLTTDALVQ